VARREDHSEVCSEDVREIGDAWRREHPEEEYVDAGGGEAGDHRCLEELARDAGVTAYDGDGPVSREDTGLAEDVRCCDGQVHSELGGQLTVREPADTVGAEEAPSAVRRAPGPSTESLHTHGAVTTAC
jgi:hypothetical protein